jgi:hypothetical protein
MIDKIKANKITVYKVEYTDGRFTQVFADKSETAQMIAEKMRPGMKVKSTTKNSGDHQPSGGYLKAGQWGNPDNS